MVSFSELTKSTQEQIDRIIKTTGLPKKDVMKQFNIVYNLDFIAVATTEAARQQWAAAKLSGDHFNRPKLEERDIVVVGFSGITKYGPQGEPFETVFAYDINAEKLIAIRLDKDNLSKVTELTLGEYYPEIHISVTDRGNMGIDDRTKIPEPQSYIGAGEGYPATLDELLTDTLGIKEIQMKDMGNLAKLSSRTTPNAKGDSYVIGTDWRCVRNCIIMQQRKSPVTGMDGVSRYNLTVTDTTVPDEQTTAQGIVIPKQMGVWAAERYAYPNFSMVNIWGPLEHRTWTEKDPDNPAGPELKRQGHQMTGAFVFCLGRGPEES